MNQRIKTFNSVQNFRDFGGYRTRDGARIVRDTLFRSAQISDASANDLIAIADLGIQFQIDLRRRSERELHPHKWQPRVLIVNEDDDEREAPHIEFLRRGLATPGSSARFMENFYATAPFDPAHIGLFRHWFEKLCSIEGPALVSCAAGKDRTGILCAITLYCLGVPYDDILSDYELTNIAVDLENQLPVVREQLEKTYNLVLEPDALKPFLGVQAKYLDTAFAAIRERCGNVHEYVSTALNLKPSVISSLQNSLLVG